MPTYNQFSVEGQRFGLNLLKRDDMLKPGELVTADNIDMSEGTLKKRSGFRRALTGTLDNVQRGGAPSSSLYVTGEEWWLEHQRSLTNAYGDTNPSTIAHIDHRRDFYHHRQGVIIIPEDDLSTMRLDVQAADPDWAIEFCLHTDSLPLFRTTGASNFAATHWPFNVILAAKGRTDTTPANVAQWAVRFIPSGDRFHAVLTLYRGSVLTQGTDFNYASGADRAWITPGKRIWLAWKYTDGGTPTITSYYWIEGASASVSSSANITRAGAGDLGTDGVGGSTYPLCIGRRPALWNRDAATQTREMGFCGSPPELRFWSEAVHGGATTLDLPTNWGVVTANPPASTDWYVEREIPEDQLTTDAAVESGNLAQTYDLKAYWQFKPELIGTSPAGAAISGESHRIIRPRYRDTGTGPNAWLTGADATWVAGGDLGTYALSFIPTGPTGQKNEYALSALSGVWHYAGYRLFAAGIRVPNGEAYLRKSSLLTGATAFEWPDAFSVRWHGRVGALPATTESMVLWQINTVRQGVPAGAVTVADYEVSAAISLAVTYDGANWRFRFSVRNGTGVATNTDSTTVVAEGTSYTAIGAVRWELNSAGSYDRDISVFVNGVREAITTTAATTKPWLSQVTGGDAVAPNEDDEDGRDACYPMSIGYSMASAGEDWAVPPSTWAMRFGSHENQLTRALYGFRYYWAFHNNETKKTPNDGVSWHGKFALVGEMKSLQVWHKYVNESEAKALATRAPNAQEKAADGNLLLSSWECDEGYGTQVFDRGTLGNHLLINPYPKVLSQTGVCQRDTKPPVLGFFQRRANQTIAGVPVREFYVLAGGCLHRSFADGSGNNYLAPIGRVQTPELYDPTNRAIRLPTLFNFGPSAYLCSGLGPVKRITSGKVLDAGLTPVFGDPGQDQTHLGWRESDRDGTFEMIGVSATGAAQTVFAEAGKWGYALTYYDPESGLESAPSRTMYIISENDGTSAGNGLSAIAIYLPPKSPQKNATKYNVYRTSKDGNVLRFVNQIDATQLYLDTLPDLKLGNDIDFADDARLNYPPPQNAQIGVVFGQRAVYTAIEGAPSTVAYSMLDKPGACPPPYQFNLDDHVIAALVLNDRLILGTRTRWYACADAGTDIGFESVDEPPIQIRPLTTEFGCISHHGCVLIPQLGWLVPTERGFYLTDGVTFRYVSRRIEPFWRTLNFNYARNFVAVYHARRGQVLFFCSTTSSPDARNDTCIVWDHERGLPVTDEDGPGGFTVYRTTPFVLSAGIVEDDDSGIDRVWLGDYFGNVWDFDPADATVSSDGVTAVPYSGTIQQTKKDPLGSGKYTRLKLVTDSSLSVTAGGLRGVNLFTTNAGTQWHTQPLRILWNDANWVTVEAAAANTTDPNGFEWRLGAIGYDLKYGKMDLGSKALSKKIARMQVNYGAAGGTTLAGSIAFDEQTAQTFTLNPSRRFDPIVNATGRCRRVQLRLYDNALYGGQPNNAIEVAEVEIDFFGKGRVTTTGA